MRSGNIEISTDPAVPNPIYPSIGNLNGKTMNRYSKRNNVIGELRNRHIEHEAEIVELKDMINFAIDYTSTLENTIENFNVGEYIADLETELESRHEEYEAEIIELRDIVNFQSRNWSNDEIFQPTVTRPWPNSMRPHFGIRPEPPKPELSIDYFEVEQISKDSEAIRARLLADEYDDSGELETGAQTRYQLIHVNAKTDVTAMGYPGINGENGVKRATAARFLHRPEDTPDDLLMDLVGIARVIGDGDSKASKLIGVMIENDWECPIASIELRFPGEFINVTIDEINEIALEETGDNLIFEEDGRLIIEEDYRDEIECILQRPQYLRTMSTN